MPKCSCILHERKFLLLSIARDFENEDIFSHVLHKSFS